MERKALWLVLEHFGSAINLKDMTNLAMLLALAYLNIFNVHT